MIFVFSGVVQREQSVIPQSSSSQSLAIVDVSENLRAKVYSLFARLGFSDLPGLTTEDYITLAIIEKYLDFKVSFLPGLKVTYTICFDQ